MYLHIELIFRLHSSMRNFLYLIYSTKFVVTFVVLNETYVDHRQHMLQRNMVRLLSYITLFQNGMRTQMFLIMTEGALYTGMWEQFVF